MSILQLQEKKSIFLKFHHFFIEDAKSLRNRLLVVPAEKRDSKAY